MLSVPYFLCFDEITGPRHLMAYHPYLNFCVLMSLHRVVSFDGMPSVPYFLYFIKITDSNSLMTCKIIGSYPDDMRSYLCVLMNL